MVCLDGNFKIGKQLSPNCNSKNVLQESTALTALDGVLIFLCLASCGFNL